MLQNVLGSDGQMHVENQVGNIPSFRPARCARLSVSPGSTGCSISTDKRSVKHRRS